MSTPAQISYITDLAVQKTKEFKEVKELIIARNIASGDSQTIANATTTADICNAMTDLQASQLIDALIATREPNRSKSYAQNRVKKTVATLDNIKAVVAAWNFN